MADTPSSAGSASKVIIAVALLILAAAVAYALINVSQGGTLFGNESSSSSSVAAMQKATSSAGVTDDTQDDTMTAAEKAEYDGCVNAATAAHNQRWEDACADAAENMQRAYNACIARGVDEASCKTSFNTQAECDLSAARENSLNAQFNVAKNNCAL